MYLVQPTDETTSQWEDHDAFTLKKRKARKWLILDDYGNQIAEEWRLE